MRNTTKCTESCQQWQVVANIGACILPNSLNFTVTDVTARH